MIKLDDNPPMLNPAVGSVRELAGQWWVVHTKSRNEKAFAWEMVSESVSYFLPMIRRTTFSGGRRRQGMMPLFPSYVFLIGDPLTRVAAMKSNRVCNVIAVDDQRQLLDELAMIDRVLASNAQLDPCPFAAIGQPVRVARGPFKGIVGRVVRRDAVTRIVMQISILGRGAEMDIEGDLLEAVE